MKFSLLFYLAIFGGIFVIQSLFFSAPDVPEWPYSQFVTAVLDNQVGEVVITADRIYGKLQPPTASAAARSDQTAMQIPSTKTPWHLQQIVDWWRSIRGEIRQTQAAREAEAKLYFTTIPLPDPGLLEKLQAHKVNYRARIETHYLKDLLQNWLVPFAVLFLVWGFVMRRMGRGPDVLQMGKSRAKIYAADTSRRVQFKDIAGVDEAIEDTKEIVTFLKEPGKFTRLGAKLPKGVLLVGPRARARRYWRGP